MTASLVFGNTIYGTRWDPWIPDDLAGIHTAHTSSEAEPRTAVPRSARHFQSMRKASIGLMEAARRAGIKHATSATAAKITGTVVKVTTSCGAMP
jgi:hypothetical protein